MKQTAVLLSQPHTALHPSASHSFTHTSGSFHCPLTSDQPGPVQLLEPNPASAGVSWAFSLPLQLICPEETTVGTSPGLRTILFLHQGLPPTHLSHLSLAYHTGLCSRLESTWTFLSLPVTPLSQTTSLNICPLHYHKLNFSSSSQAWGILGLPLF